MEKILDWIAKRFCRKREYSRAEIRKLWPKRKQVTLSTESEEEDDNLTEGIDPEETKKEEAARRIQRIVRGFVGRRRGLAQANYVLNEVDAYWLDHYARLLEEERQRLILSRNRRMVAKQFTHDVITVSKLYVIALDDASTIIQRTWRGYWVRKHRPKPRLPPIMRPKPRVIKGRHLPETLRRVWARSLFEPSGTSYLHKTEVGYKIYDMWGHVKHPPAGNKHGLRTRKITLPASDDPENVRVGKTVFAATDDRHAWIGVPIGLEDYDTIEQEKYLRSFRNMEKFLFAFPVSSARRESEVRDVDAVEVVAAEIRNPYGEELFRRSSKSRKTSGKGRRHRVQSTVRDTDSAKLANRDEADSINMNSSDKIAPKTKRRNMSKSYLSSVRPGLQSIPELPSDDIRTNNFSESEHQESDVASSAEQSDVNGEGEDDGQELVMEEDEDAEENVPDPLITRRHLSVLTKLAAKRTAELKKQLDRINSVAKGDHERGSKHWDALTGRYLQYLGQGRYRHLKTGKETVPPLENQLSQNQDSKDGNQATVISHSGRQNAEETLPLNHYDPSLLQLQQIEQSCGNGQTLSESQKLHQHLHQIVLLPAAMSTTPASALAAGDSTSLARPSESSELGSNTQQQQQQQQSETLTGPSSGEIMEPLLGRSRVSITVLKSGHISVHDTWDKEDAPPQGTSSVLQQQRRAQRHRQMFHETFRISAKLSSSATHQPPLQRHLPRTTTASMSKTTAPPSRRQQPPGPSPWSQFKQQLSQSMQEQQQQQQQQSAHSGGESSSQWSQLVRQCSTAKMQQEQASKRRTPHYRSVYTWLPQPLLSGALQQHHYRDLSAVESYNAQKQRVFARRTQRLQQHARKRLLSSAASSNIRDALEEKSDDSSSVSVSVSQDTLAPHSMSLSVSQIVEEEESKRARSPSASKLSHFMESESVLSLVSRRPPQRLVSVANSQVGTLPKVLSMPTMSEEAALEEEYDAETDSSGRVSLSSSSQPPRLRDPNAGQSIPRDQQWKKQQWRAEIENDLFSEDQERGSHEHSTNGKSYRKNTTTNNNKTNSQEAGMLHVDSTASLRPFQSFLHAGEAPQSLPEALSRRQRSLTTGLAVSSSLTLSPMSDKGATLVHRKFQDRPSVLIPGSQDYLQQASNVSVSSNQNSVNSRKNRNVSMISMATRDAKIAPLSPQPRQGSPGFDFLTPSSLNSPDTSIILSTTGQSMKHDSNKELGQFPKKAPNVRLGSALEQNSQTLDTLVDGFESSKKKRPHQPKPALVPSRPRPSQPPTESDLHPYPWL